LIIAALLSAFLGAVIGYEKGRTVLGGLLGLLFGPFGIIAVAAIEPSREIRQLRRELDAEAIAERLAEFLTDEDDDS
jgi:hypothetical protein